jgi:predicted MFS family arabinose efflux permease
MLQAWSLVIVLLTVRLFIISKAMLLPALSSLTSKRATGGQGIAMSLNNSFMSLGLSIPRWASGFSVDSGLCAPGRAEGVR